MCLIVTSLVKPREKSRKVYKTVRLTNGTVSSTIYSYTWKVGVNKPESSNINTYRIGSGVYSGVFHVYTDKKVAERLAQRPGYAVITLTAHKEHFVASEKKKHTACYTQLTVTKRELNAVKARQEKYELEQAVKSIFSEIHYSVKATIDDIKSFKGSYSKVSHPKKAKILKLEQMLKKLYAQTGK